MSTEIIQQDKKASFLDAIARVRNVAAPGWVKTLREQGASRFSALELPSRKHETWRFTNISPVLTQGFTVATEADAAVSRDELAPFLYPGEDWAVLVFVDGFFKAALSQVDALPKGVSVVSVTSLEKPSPEAIGDATENAPIFEALNAACFADGYAIRVEEGVQAEKPIHLLHLSSAKHAGHASHPRNSIVVGAGASVSIVESVAALAGAESYFNNPVTEILLGKGASLEHIKTVEEHGNAFHHTTTRVRLGAEAKLNAFIGVFGGRIIRNDYRLLFADAGSECDLNGLVLGDGDRLIDNALNLDHDATRCRSRMAFKHVLDGSSRGVFTGKVNVCRGAQQTDSDQLSNALLLSDDATVDTKPQLEIYADDVKCTHGATIGSPPPELVFYFQSRGIDLARARGILTYGFAAEVLNKIGLDPVRARLAAYVFDKYSPK